MKKIGICIDGVIRDRFEQFDRIYRKKFIKNEGIVQMNNNFEYIAEDEDEDENKRISNLEKSLIHLPVTTYDLKNHYEFENESDYLKFMEDYSLEIFGSAPAFHRSMDVVNRLQYAGENAKIFNISLICPGDEQLVTATFYFMTKNACRIKNITFKEYDEKLWEQFDVIITDCPNILDTKPEGKVSIKVTHDYNVGSNSDHTIENISELYELPNVKKMFGITK